DGARCHGRRPGHARFERGHRHRAAFVALRGAEAARDGTARPLVPVRTRRDELRRADDPHRGTPALGVALVRPRPRGRLLARLCRRALSARHRRRGGAWDRRGYSSSPARKSPAAITSSDAIRLMKIPIPRPRQPKNASGIEIRRISTKIVESEPRAITTRLSGTVAGSSMPDSRRATIASTARPMKKTSLPSAPVCQPITAVVTPWPPPAYQSVKAERLRSRPESHVSRPPQAQIPLNGRIG